MRPPKFWDEAKLNRPYNCGTIGEAAALERKLNEALETDEARHIKYASWYIDRQGRTLIFRDFREDQNKIISIKVIQP